MKKTQQQLRMASARVDILRQRFLAPILSIEGHTELLKDLVDDEGCLADIIKIEAAANQTRHLVDEMLSAELKTCGETERENQRSTYRHDLRNSVGAIAGYSEIILEELEDADLLTPDAKTYLSDQLSDSDTLLNMLDVMFDVDKELNEESQSSLNMDINSVFDSFERSDKDEIKTISGRILVVDDNAINVNLLSHQLRRQGHEIFTGMSGRQALALIKEETPDLLLLDLFMPDMNGFDVLREMQKDDTLRAIPVIIITGLSDKSAAIKCMAAGAFDILVKPVNFSLLHARVTGCLERKAWHDKEQEYLRELEKNHRFVRKVFGRYLSDSVVKKILDEEDGMQLGGGKQNITIMMTDIRGFSVLSQALEPEDCVKILNNYFGVMTPLIHKYNGVINEFLGDAILAIFGAPVTSDIHAEQAVACAIEMQNAMKEVNCNSEQFGLPSIDMGISLNTGEVVVGNIGSENRSKYGIVGHHVNLTGRIESFTVGGQIMASEFTVNAVQPEAMIKNSLEVEAKGIKGLVKIHEITGIGVPYNLYLDADEQVVLPLQQELPVIFNILSGKAVDDELAEGMLAAVGEDRVHFFTLVNLENMTNLRMTIPSYYDNNDQVFSKVTSIVETDEEKRYYILKLTSASPNIRKYLRSLMVQSS